MSRRALTLTLAALLLSLLTTPYAAPSPAAAAPVAAQPRAAQPKAAKPKAAALRVASYNVTCANCRGSGPDAGTWALRRAAVAAVIRQQRPDVVGLQEASQGWLVVGGRKVNRSQFEDLQLRVGAPYRLTNAKRNNCVRHTTPVRCRYRYQGASQGTRILYNTRRLALVAAGAQRLPSVDVGSNQRYLAWARFRDRATGRTFVFGNTQLEHRHDTARTGRRYYLLKKRQAATVVATVRRATGGRVPSVIVGDFNSSRFFTPDNGPVNVVTRAGYVNPLGGRERTTKTAPGATVERRVNTWLNSYNGFRRVAPGHRSWPTGSHIDYVFVSRGTRVAEFEVVARLDARRGRLVGRIPSDHHMLRATVWMR